MSNCSNNDSTMLVIIRSILLLVIFINLLLHIFINCTISGIKTHFGNFFFILGILDGDTQYCIVIKYTYN